jgi:Reverse transcriptase (RNA-dependent DNA polymerase)
VRVEFNGWERQFAFLQADVAFPIIGLDFLRFFVMQVNPSSSEILVPTPQRSQGGGTDGGGGKSAARVCFSAKKEAPVPQPKAAAGARPIHPRIQQLPEEFPGLVRPAAAAAPQPRHGVVHHIETNGRPVFAKARRLEPAKRKVAEEEFAALEKAGIVSRSMLPWASPLHMVPKKDGSWRPCGAYRCLITITVPDRYPLPNLMDLSANMDGCTVFSKIDLVKAFHQVPIAPEDRKKMAVITPFGLFEYNYMPFGLCNAAQTF